MNLPKGSLDYTDYVPEYGVLKVFDTFVTYHCNVFNHYFAESTLITLGNDLGIRTLYEASEFAHFRLFRNLKDRLGLSAEELLEFGKHYYKSRGMGVLEIKGINDIFLIASTSAHTYIKVSRGFFEFPTCNVERGFIAGLLEAALDVPPGYIKVEEDKCIGMGDPICKMRVIITREKNPRFRDVSYDGVPLNKRPGKEERVRKMREISKAFPEPDESGVLAIPSRFEDIKQVWIVQLPTEYYAYTNMVIAENALEEVAKYTLTAAGYNCVLFTYISLAHSPVGDVVIGDVREPDEYFKRLAEIGNYLGFGIFEVADIRNSGGRVSGSINLFNFYENNYLMAMGRSARSYFLAGATLAFINSVFWRRVYALPSMGTLIDWLRDFDELYNGVRYQVDFNDSENSQRIDFEFGEKKVGIT